MPRERPLADVPVYLAVDGATVRERLVNSLRLELLDGRRPLEPPSRSNR